MHSVVVRQLGLQDYLPVWKAMQSFTDSRGVDSLDEIWVLEHFPVFSLGRSAKDEVFDSGGISVVQSDRGGKVTYHGPGQLVVYTLFDLSRNKLGIRQLVSALEQVVVDFLAGFGVKAYADRQAPGVYVDGCKLASLGLRVRKGRCFHGLSVNVDMDLSPFKLISPCGLEGVSMTQVRDLGISLSMSEVCDALLDGLFRHFQYNVVPGSKLELL